MIKDSIQQLNEQVNSVNVRFDMLHLKLNTRMQDVRSNLTEIRENITCRFYAQGRCNRIDCKYAHDAAPDLYRSKGRSKGKGKPKTSLFDSPRTPAISLKSFPELTAEKIVEAPQEQIQEKAVEVSQTHAQEVIKQVLEYNEHEMVEEVPRTQIPPWKALGLSPPKRPL